MQPRLTRSRTEIILAGVCAGLGEYFGVDPVIIRLIFILVTLTTGLGLLIYPILWLAMPRAPLPTPVQPYALQQEQPTYIMPEPATRDRQPVMQSRVAGPRTYTDAPPPPSAYQYDPLTGQPISQPPPAVSQTIQLPDDPQIQGQPIMPLPLARPHRKSKGWGGFILLSIGILGLANALHINMDLAFPVLLIGLGMLLLLRRH